MAPSSSRRLTAWAGGDRLEAQGVSIQVGTIPRLGEDQEGLASGEPGSVEGVPAEPVSETYLSFGAT